MCACAYMCMYVCLGVGEYMCLCDYPWLCARVCARVCVYLCMYVCLGVGEYMCLCDYPWLCVCVCARACVCARVCLHACVVCSHCHVVGTSLSSVPGSPGYNFS